MSALLQAELIKLRTTRTFLALAGVAIGISLLVVVLSTSLIDPDEEVGAADLLDFDTTGLFILMLGVIGITGEWRHRTITSSLLAAPDRIRFLVAKLIAYATAGLVLSLVITLLLAVVGTIILSVRGLETPEAGEIFALLWRNVLVSALLGALGVAVGAVVRNQVVAVVGLLLIPLFLEPLIGVLAPEVGRFGPFSAAGALVAAGDGGFLDDPVELSRIAALLVVLAWIAGMAAIGGLLLRRRDLA